MIGKNRGFVVLNTLSLAIMFFANYAANANIFSSITVGQVSNKYDTLFAPAGYAFAIWIFIFLLCICFVAQQWFLLSGGDPKQYIRRTGIWFTISNIANTAWLYCWTNEMLGTSVILILLLLLSLIIITIQLRLELDDEPVRTIIFVWWPITFYLGWIMVATIACIAAWLTYIAWDGGPFGQDIWTILMISVASTLYLFLIINRNMREAAAVGIWAFIAIAVKQFNVHTNIVITAMIAAAILLAGIAIHAFKNKDYSPMAKIKRGEWK